MKTTLEIRDSTFRRAKTFAASKGITLKELFNEALEEKLQDPREKESKKDPAWLKLAGRFGRTRAEREETRRIQRAIDAEFERIEPEG